MDPDTEGLVRKCEQCQLHQKVPAEAPPTPVGMAKRTLDTAVRRLCRTIKRGDVLDRSGRLFQMTRSTSDEVKNF